MDPAEQLKLVREFMLAIAPVVTGHHLDQGGYTPRETAQMALEWSIHLAGQYASCYDQLHAPENAPQTSNPIKAYFETSSDTA